MIGADTSPMTTVYIWIGTAFITSVIVLALMLLLAVGLMIHKRDLFPRFSLGILNLFYHPAKLLLSYLHINHIIVDEMGIALMNSIYRNAYERTPLNERIVFLPQCLRSLECPAKTSPKDGIICVACGKCGIAGIKKLCDEHGVAICIAPGGEFVKRAIKERKPGGALGVACQHDLYEVMRYVTSKGIPMIGIVLTRSGCVSTDVNWDEVKRAICSECEVNGKKPIASIKEK